MLNSIRIEDITNVTSGIEIIKIIRTVTRLPLKEAKDLWDRAKIAPVVFESIGLNAICWLANGI